MRNVQYFLLQRGTHSCTYTYTEAPTQTRYVKTYNVKTVEPKA